MDMRTLFFLFMSLIGIRIVIVSLSLSSSVVVIFNSFIFDKSENSATIFYLESLFSEIGFSHRYLLKIQDDQHSRSCAKVPYHFDVAHKNCTACFFISLSLCIVVSVLPFFIFLYKNRLMIESHHQP